MIIFISDFDLTGSGYMNIAIASCNELSKFGWNVKALGMGYNGSEHNWDFSIIPVPHADAFARIPAMIHNLKALASAGQCDPIEAIIVALDIPMQGRFLTLPSKAGIPYIGVFPVESGPLCLTWATMLQAMDERLVISKFGLRQMETVGIDGIYLPIGIDAGAWRVPQPEERKMLRESMSFTDDQYIILTVADNQERKNLARAAEVIAEVAKVRKNVRWLLVTRKECPVGWRLNDLFLDLGILGITAIYERGLPHDRLWVLHAVSDMFLLTSKAEGLCMPIMEAMATRLPVVATECTAIPEHFYDDPVWERESKGIWTPFGKFNKPKGQRGFAVRSEYYTRDPWGNSMRAFFSTEEGVKTILKIMDMKQNQLDKITLAARQYVESRNWKEAGQVLDAAIRRAIKKNTKLEEERKFIPPTVPQLVPIQVVKGGIDGEAETQSPVAS